MSDQSTIRSLLIFLLILGLISPNFNFILSEQSTPPDTPEEAVEMGKEVTEEAKENLPGILEKIWKEEILPFWKRMIIEVRSFIVLCFTRAWDWTKECWKDTLWPRLKGLWERKVKSPVEEEAEKRKEIIEERVEKEKKEIEEKFISETSKSIWGEIKDFWE